ncbi:hypothetical protein [Arthrobacter sp. Z1-15]
MPGDDGYPPGDADNQAGNADADKGSDHAEYKADEDNAEEQPARRSYFRFRMPARERNHRPFRIFLCLVG